jgi:hypothetical protein
VSLQDEHVLFVSQVLITWYNSEYQELYLCGGCYRAYNHHPKTTPTKLVTPTWFRSDSESDGSYKQNTSGSIKSGRAASAVLRQGARSMVYIGEGITEERTNSTTSSHSWTTVTSGKCGTSLLLRPCRNHKLNWRPSCWTGYPLRERSAHVSSSRERKWRPQTIAVPETSQEPRLWRVAPLDAYYPDQSATIQHPSRPCWYARDWVGHSCPMRRLYHRSHLPCQTWPQQWTTQRFWIALTSSLAKRISALGRATPAPRTVVPVPETLAITLVIAALAPGTVVQATDLIPEMTPQPQSVRNIVALGTMLKSIPYLAPSP